MDRSGTKKGLISIPNFLLSKSRVKRLARKEMDDMRFWFTEEQNKFRREVHDFLKAEIKTGAFAAKGGGLVGEGHNQEFSKKMSQKGWIGMTWPKEYGGQGRAYVDKLILNEEIIRVQAPVAYHFLADRQIGPSIIHFGSEWQKEYFLPRFVKAENNMRFCLLFSEPNAGSDLVSVETSATKDGDSYIIRGGKVWTSGGHLSDYGWLLARTCFDPKVPRAESCSQFILDMRLPGVTVRPIINMAGRHAFNEVIFNDVRVENRFMVGKENEAFKQIMAQMDYERSGIERLMQNYSIYEKLIDHVKKMEKKKGGEAFYSWVRDSVAQLETEFHIGRLMVYYTAWTIDQGRKPSKEAAMAKAYCNQYEQRLNDLATRILGPSSLLRWETPWAAFDGELAESYLISPSYTLQGGSVEVLKNIVAQRGLNLPRK
jgi:alkylation response protein AidB-like acyl-CoA dehydrogenase